MLLAIDVGNTNIVFSFFSGAEEVYTFRAASDRNKTADEYGLLLRQFFATNDIQVEALEGVVLASVVPTLTQAIERLCRRYLKKEVFVITSSEELGMPILLDEPAQLGADRLVNAIAAYEKYGGPLISIDFGTATTFECVSAAGEYLGGAIAPGLTLSVEALFNRTAKLPLVELTPPEHAIGKNTDECIRSGVVLGSACMVDSLIEEMWREMGGPCHVIATGGLSSQMASICRHIDQVDKGLTLYGLYLLWQRQQQKLQK